MPEGPDTSKELDLSIRRMEAGIRNEVKVIKVPVGVIRPSPFQPRQKFEQAALEELARSIKQDGLNEPVIVRRVHEEDSEFLFELVAGERRLRAIKLLGEPAIDAIIKDYDDRKTKRIGLVENIQRENLNAVETAYGIDSLRGDYEKECREKGGEGDERALVAAVAEEIGKDRKTVERYIRICEGIRAIPEMEELFRRHADRISFREARDYAGVADRLRALRKSNSREYARILKRLAKDFSDRKDRERIRKGVDYLQKYFGRDRKGRGLPLSFRGTMLRETPEKLILTIEVEKSTLAAEDIGSMDDACREFLEKLRALARSKG